MRPYFHPTVFALAASLLLLQGAYAADRSTYRWTDEKGRVHYSDVRTGKSQPVLIKPGSGISNAPNDSTAAVAAKQLECQRKKDQVAVYNSSAQISETDSLGNTRNYSAAERQQLIDRAQLQADSACSPAVRSAGQAGAVDENATRR